MLVDGNQVAMVQSINGVVPILSASIVSNTAMTKSTVPTGPTKSTVPSKVCTPFSSSFPLFSTPWFVVRYFVVLLQKKAATWPPGSSALLVTCVWTSHFVATVNSTAAIEATNAIVQVGIFLFYPPP